MGSQLLALLITGLGLHWAWGTGWALPCFLAHGLLLNYLFAAQHELNHYTGFLQLYPRDYERCYDSKHHRHTENWERGPELLSRGGPYPLASFLPHLFGITYWTRRIDWPFSVAAGNTANYYITYEKRKDVVELRAHLGTYSRAALLSVVTGSWFAVTYWLTPIFATKVFRNVQNIAEHTAHNIVHECGGHILVQTAASQGRQSR